MGLAPRVHRRQPTMPLNHGPPDEPKLDPVSGMTVRAEPPTDRRAEHGGETYWFCGAGCQRKFVAEPSRYSKPKPAVVPAGAADDRIYTCPMHPEIRQKGPGSCPICGMALEPAEVTES